jgi:hypothetical protein
MLLEQHEEHRRLHKIGGTNNYAQNKNLRKSPKSLKQRAKKIMRKTKLPKISKKLPSWRGQ